MDPANVTQYGGGPQTGGFLDPGLSALLAALLSGGIGFYGYSKTTDADKKAAADAAIKGLGTQFEQKAKENEAALNEFKKNQATAERNAARVKTLTAEVARLRGQLNQSSGDSALFAGESSDNLLAAVQPTLDGLKQAGLVTAGNEAAVKKALEYAARPEVRLLRMSLPTFYAKQIAPALAMKGGRRRRRRGGAGEELDRMVAEQRRQDAAIAAAQEFKGLEDAFNTPAAANSPPPPIPVVGVLGDAAAEATVPPPAAEATVPPPAAEATVPPPAAETGDKTYDIFIKVYAKAISDAKAGQIKRIQDTEVAASAKRKTAADAKATAKANAAAVKSAQAIIPKVESAIADGEKAIDEQSELVATLDESRQDTLATVKRGLLALIDQARELVGTPSTQEVKPKKKSWFSGGFGGTGESILGNVATAADWQQLNTPTKVNDLLQQIKDKIKEYKEAVKKAQKEETKELTDIGRRSLFRITVPSSPSNPFAGLIKKLSDPSKSYTESQIAAIVREETKAKVDFIKNIFKSVDMILTELEKLRKKNALPPKKKGGRRRKARGGAKTPAELAAERTTSAESAAAERAKKGPSAEDQCVKVREEDGYKNGDPQYLHDRIKAIAYGSLNEVDGIEWVAKKPASPTQKSTLKYLLDRLNTGLFASAADYLKGVRGKEVTYTPDDVILAGEAYVLLRCYLKKATEVVKGFIKDDTVLADIQRGMAESAKAREEKAALRKSTSDAVADAQAQIDGLEEDFKARQKKLIDFKVLFQTKAGTTGPGTFDPKLGYTSDESLALTGTLAALDNANRGLEKFRMSDLYQQFLASAGTIFSEEQEEGEEPTNKFNQRKGTFIAESRDVYDAADKAIQDAIRVAESVAKKNRALYEAVQGMKTAVPGDKFEGVNPLIKKTSEARKATAQAARAAREAETTPPPVNFLPNELLRTITNDREVKTAFGAVSPYVAQHRAEIIRLILEERPKDRRDEILDEMFRLGIGEPEVNPDAFLAALTKVVDVVISKTQTQLTEDQKQRATLLRDTLLPAALARYNEEVNIFNAFDTKEPGPVKDAFYFQGGNAIAGPLMSAIKKKTPVGDIQWNGIFDIGAGNEIPVDEFARRLTSAMDIVIERLASEVNKTTARAIRDEIPAALARYKQELEDREKRREEETRRFYETANDPNDTTITELSQSQFEMLSEEGKKNWKKVVTLEEPGYGELKQYEMAGLPVPQPTEKVTYVRKRVEPLEIEEGKGPVPAIGTLGTASLPAVKEHIDVYGKPLKEADEVACALFGTPSVGTITSFTKDGDVSYVVAKEEGGGEFRQPTKACVKVTPETKADTLRRIEQAALAKRGSLDVVPRDVFKYMLAMVAPAGPSSLAKDISAASTLQAWAEKNIEQGKKWSYIEQPDKSWKRDPPLPTPAESAASAGLALAQTTQPAASDQEQGVEMASLNKPATLAESPAKTEAKELKALITEAVKTKIDKPLEGRTISKEVYDELNTLSSGLLGRWSNNWEGVGDGTYKWKGLTYAQRVGSVTRVPKPGKESPYEKAKAWVMNVWRKATGQKKKDLSNTEEYKEAMNTLEKIAGEGKPHGTITGGGPEEDAAEAERLLKELQQFGGRRSRKSTLKKRRGGKQNGRRTRRGKNRANRSHSHAR